MILLESAARSFFVNNGFRAKLSFLADSGTVCTAFCVQHLGQALAQVMAVAMAVAALAQVMAVAVANH